MIMLMQTLSFFINKIVNDFLIGKYVSKQNVCAQTIYKFIKYCISMQYIRVTILFVAITNYQNLQLLFKKYCSIYLQILPSLISPTFCSRNDSQNLAA